MQSAVTPFLMFEGQAEEAMNLYVQTIPDSEILNVQKYGPDGPRAGRLRNARFDLPSRPARAPERQLRLSRLHLHAGDLAVRRVPKRRGDR